MAVVYLVTGDAFWAAELARLLEPEGYRVNIIDMFHDPNTAEDSDPEPDVILIDVEDFRRHTETLLAELQRTYPLVELIAFYSGNQVDAAVRAFRSGVFDLLPKSAGAMEVLEKTRAAADRKSRCRKRIDALKGSETKYRGS